MIKWVDLCLGSEADSGWCWFEFKARHAGVGLQKEKAALAARYALCKDIVALMGFDTYLTADTCEKPDKYTLAYWFKNLLQPYVENLKIAKQHFVAAFLQLADELDPEIWNEKALIEQIHKWFSHRAKQAGRQCTCLDVKIASPDPPLAGNHSLLVCEWSGNS